MEDKWLSHRLINWYDEKKRDLPWRNTSDPYIIWISEIILQQTRVDQGLSYFLRFVDAFPDVQSLAAASEDEVLKMWQGLGYYSRARNLHKAAKTIVDEFDGKFPADYQDIRKLKGIGEYTAAAIASFAYGLPYAVVDGNVYRFYARLFNEHSPIDSGEGKRLFAALSQKYLSADDPATYNQAVMEFGALHCVPRNPDCERCVFADKCLAKALKTVDILPVKKAKTAIKNRYFNYFRVKYGANIYLNKRTAGDIWQNLYEYILIETKEEMSLNKLRKMDEFEQTFSGVEGAVFRLVAEGVTHILSHRKIIVNFYEVELNAKLESLNKFICIDESDFENYPVSRLIHSLSIL